MSSSKDLPPDVPFSLTCEYCDAGMEIESREEALAAGWTDIEFVRNCPLANFIGTCPGCSRQEK